MPRARYSGDKNGSNTIDCRTAVELSSLQELKISLVIKSYDFNVYFNRLGRLFSGFFSLNVSLHNVHFSMI